jgi:cyclopropane fatty-acyl-phospholipid synthase-like methyltransferase
VAGPRASDIGHRTLAICNPIGAATLDRVVEYATVAREGTALDIGCGKGEFLLRLAARYGCAGVGFDLNGARVEAAAREADARGLGDRVRFVAADAHDAARLPGPFALTACIGSTHALGGLPATLASLHSWTEPGGWVVVGEGHWSRPPAPEYLSAIGATREELGADGWVEQAALVAGLDPVQRWTATREEWDAYEGTLLANLEGYAAETPRDEAAPAMLAEQRSFHEAQLRWGRDTMGFATYLLRRRERRDDRPHGLG